MTRGQFAILLLILLVAFLARIIFIDSQSFWIDEIFTLETSAGNGLAHERVQVNQWLESAPPLADVSRGGGIGGIIRNAHEDTQAPLYFMLLNLWRRAAGSGEMMVRLPSAVFSTLCVAALFGFMRELTAKPLVPLLAAGMAAISGAQVIFAQEARPYAMGLFYVCAAAWALASIERRGFNGSRGGALAVSLLLLMFTHYAGAAPALAMFAYSLMRLRGRDRWRAIGCFAAAGIAFLIAWGPILWQQRSAGDHLSFLSETGEDHGVNTIGRALRHPVIMLLASPAVSQLGPVWYWVAPVAGILIIGIPAWQMRNRPALLLPWLLMIAPIALAAFSDLISQRAALELPRFTFFGTVGAIGVLAILLAGAAGGLRIPLIVATLLLLVLNLTLGARIGPAAAYELGKPDTRNWAYNIAKDLRPGDVLVVAKSAHDTWQAGSLYAAVAHYVAPPGPVVFLERPPDDSLLAKLRAAPGIVMISPTPAVPHAQLFPGAAIEMPIRLPNMGTYARLHLP